MPQRPRTSRRSVRVAELAIAVAAISSTVELRSALAAHQASSATAQQTAPATAASTSNYIEHVVQANETLWRIARESGTPVDLIAQINNLSPPYAVHTGQKLMLPKPSEGVAPTSAGAPAPVGAAASAAAPPAISLQTETHVVAPDETFWRIARNANASVEELAQINKLQPPYLVTVGQRLIVPVRPTGSTPPPPPPRPMAQLSREAYWETDYDLHVVGPDETFWRIAHNAHVSVEELAALNHMGEPFTVRPGQRILLPNPSMGAYWPIQDQPKFAAVSRPAPKGGTTATPSATTADKPALTAKGAPAIKAPVAPPTVTAMSRQPRQNHTIVLPMKDGNTYLGDVASTVSADGVITFSTNDTLLVLSKTVNQSAFDRIKAALGDRKTLTAEDMKAAGYPAFYDAANLEIRMTIPATDRPKRALDVASLDPSLIGAVEKPVGFSGYLNMRGSFDYVSEGTSSTHGLGDPLVLVDGAVRLNGIVLEGEGQYTNQSGVKQFSRQGTRFVYDNTKLLARFTLGDLRVSTTGFQGGVDLVGLSVSRLYSQLSPQENVRPRGERSFLLTRDSTVETYINGRSVQQIRLPAGTYDLHNFPFVDGANDVNVVIQDDTGHTETLKFSIFFDRTLLKPGLTEFGAYAGAMSQIANGEPKYNDKDIAFTGFWRHGFSDSLTMGGNVQYDNHFRLAGLETVWASMIGTLGMDAAFSDSDTFGSGYAVNIGLQHLVQERQSYRSQSFNLSLESRSAKFSTLGAQTISNPYSMQVAAAYNRSFNQFIFAGLDLRYSTGRSGVKDVTSANATMGYRFDEFTNGTVNLSYADGGFTNGTSVGFSITRRLGRTRTLTGDFDTLTDQQRISYVDTAGRGVGSWNVAANVEHTGGQVKDASFNGSATYLANRGEFGIAHTTSYNTATSGISDQRTSMRFASSFAFAGGAVGVGRPIYDSFALFQPHHSLNGAEVIVDPSPEGYFANSGLFGSAVLGELGSYALRTASYDVPTAPTGYDIGQATVRLLPPYKSGYLITVGSDYAVTIVGRLLDPEGKPITLLAGKAFDLEHPEHPPVILFTSRDGRFAGEGLRTGRWRIEMPTPIPAVYSINIPVSAGSLYKLDDLRPDGVHP